MGKRLERFGEVRLVDETNSFGLDFVKKTENGYKSTSPDVGAVLERRTDLGLAYSFKGKEASRGGTGPWGDQCLRSLWPPVPSPHWTD